MECTDYLGFPIKEGDRVIFPNGAEMMPGIVTSLGNGSKKTGKILSIRVKNENGYIKSKRTHTVLNISVVKNGMPEYFL